MALLPIGGTFTMDLAEAVRAAMAIKPKVVIPMHRSKADPQDFKNVCLQKVLDRSGKKIREGFRSQIPSFGLLSNL